MKTKSSICSFLLFCLLFKSNNSFSQIALLNDTAKVKLELGIYADVYYGNNFTGDSLPNVPYFVSSARNNELNINLAYVKIKFSTDRLRVRIAPALGTYMNGNYAAEQGSFKNFLYAYTGVKLFKKKNIWLDAGIIDSPFTNEGPVSFEQPMYTRSFAAEYVPYYLGGIKLGVPLSSKLNASIYVINGWQQLQDVNAKKSIGTQLEFKPSQKHLLNWNTYIGDERSANAPSYRARYFTDLYWVYNDEGKFTLTTCAYVGFQEIAGQAELNNWWQINGAARFRFNDNYSVSVRLEYFNDENNAVITPVLGIGKFNTSSASICFTRAISKHALIRLEGREFFSDSKHHYYKDKNTGSTNNLWLTGSITASF